MINKVVEIIGSIIILKTLWITYPMKLENVIGFALHLKLMIIK